MKIIQDDSKKSKENVANYIFALYIALIPILISLIGFFYYIKVDIFLIVFFVAYFIFLLIKLKTALLKNQISKNSIKNFLKKPLIISFLVLFITMIVSSIINGFNIDLLTYFSVPLIILCFYFLSKNQVKNVIFVWLIVISICVLMGYFDPQNLFMPGFNRGSFPLCLQFLNPNYSAEVVATALAVNIYMFLKSRSKSLKIMLFFSFLNFALFLFLNGSFMSISAIFLILFISLIVFIKRNKNYAKWTFIFLVSMIAVSVLVDLIPFLYNNRATTCANYFVEVLGACDSLIGTNFLQLFAITNQHGIDTSVILGFDGWDRQELWDNAIVNISNSPIFGYGAGSFMTFRPHNVFLSLALDFGLLAGICYISIIVCLLQIFFKNKNKSLIQYAFLMAIIVNVVVGLLGSLNASAHIYSFMCIGLFLNKKVSNDSEFPLFSNSKVPLKLTDKKSLKIHSKN